MAALSILIVTDSEAFSKEAQAAFTGASSLEIAFTVCRPEQAQESVKKLKPAILLLKSGESPQDIVPIGENVRVVCAGHPTDISVVMKLAKAGVKDFLNVPFEELEIQGLLREMAASVSPIKKDFGGRAKVVCVYSPKGGSGVTLLTTNLAVALASNKKYSVVACDFSPQCGDVATYLNLGAKYTFHDILANNSLLDVSFLEGVMLEHPSGVKVIAAPSQEQPAPDSSHLHALKSILGILKQNYQYVVVDASHLEPALLQYILSESDIVFLVGSPDVVSLKGLLIFINKLRSSHYDTAKVKVVINRDHSKNQIDSKEFEKMAKFPISYRLPNNFQLCIEAVNTGRPIFELQDKSGLAKMINDLADAVRGDSPAASNSSTPVSGGGPLDVLKKGLFR